MATMKEESEPFESPIFGPCRKLNEESNSLANMQLAVTTFPVDTFQILNRYLNELGFMISIVSKEEVVE